MNNYILSYSPFLDNPSEGQLLNHVQVNKFISAYYQPFIGTYVLKSQHHISIVADSLRGLFGSAPHTVSQVFSNAIGGTLPNEVWHWLNHDIIPTPDVPPSQPAIDAWTKAMAPYLKK